MREENLELALALVHLKVHTILPRFFRVLTSSMESSLRR